MKSKKKFLSKQLAEAILGLKVETLPLQDRYSAQSNSLENHLDEDENGNKVALVRTEKADFTLKDKKWIRRIIGKKLSLKDIL